MNPATKLIKKVSNNLRIFININFSENLWLSLGENCLSDGILQRHNLKSFSTPYSNGRSNLDYALALEKINYIGYLDKTNLFYDSVNDEKVVKSSLIKNSDNIYFTPHMSGFEFTHHDVINSENAIKNLKRKTTRILKIRGKKNVVFLYHYRINENSNHKLLFNKAIEFVNLYISNRSNCNILVFSQKIINHPSDRKVLYKSITPNVHFFELYTEKIWTGPDQDTFWAKKDDDLIKIMLNYASKIVLKNSVLPEGLVLLT